MPLSREQLGFVQQRDVDPQGHAVNIITRHGAPTGPLVDHKDSGIKFDEGIEALKYFSFRVRRVLNEFVANEQIQPPFEAGEILFSPFSDNPALRPDKVAALVRERGADGKTVVRVAHISPLELQTTTQRLSEGDKEVKLVTPTFDMGNAGKLLTLPVDFGRAEGLMSMVMEKVGSPTDPIVVVGQKAELERKLTSVNLNSEFVPIRFTREQRNHLNAMINEAVSVYGNSRPNIPEALEADGVGNVTGYDVDWQNGRFAVGVSVDVEDGRKVGFHLNPVLNFNYEQDGSQKSEETEASVFCVLTSDSRGEPLIATVMQRRLHGNTGAVEIPRGFANNLWKELREEIGLDSNFVVDYRRSSVKLAEDPVRANILPDFNTLVLPSDKKYHLEAENDREAAEMEIISPDWMRLDEFIEGAVSGEFVGDVHTVAGLFNTLVEAGAFNLNAQAGDLAIVMEKVQDFRSGGYRLMIPRGDSSRSRDVLKGSLNPNSGLYRIWNEIGYGDEPSVLKQDGSYDVVSLRDVLGMIGENKIDIVTMATLFRFMLQKGYASVDLSAAGDYVNSR